MEGLVQLRRLTVGPGARRHNSLLMILPALIWFDGFAARFVIFNTRLTARFQLRCLVETATSSLARE